MGEEGNNMDKRIINCNSEEAEVRKGPWTLEEDLILINYIATHGEGVWNTVAKAAGLKRTGKSCRLRWLNYLRPDVRRGNITPEEQLLIIELHARWGNRWSKIARQLPGRTDNEIKNYWRTRIQKKTKQGETMDYNNCMLMENGASTSHSASSSGLDRDEVFLQHNYAAVVHQQPSAMNADAFAPMFSNESSASFWDVDEFWSMHSING